MLKQYKCLLHTTSGKLGQIIERDTEDNRVSELVRRGIIEEYSPEVETENKMAKKPENKAAKKAK